MTSATKWGDDCWKTPKHACLSCGYVVDAASPNPLEPEPRGPEEGDVTICLQCSHIMVFTADKRVRNATADELAEIISDPDTQKLLLAMKLLRQSNLWKRRHAKNR